MARTKFSLEYQIRSSPSILYSFLTTPSGLTQWFCESCDINEDIYTFGWDGSTEDAQLVEGIDPEKVVYVWVDGEEDEYFSLKSPSPKLVMTRFYTSLTSLKMTKLKIKSNFGSVSLSN